MTGLPVSGLMVLGLLLQDGRAREVILHGWWSSLWILFAIRHTWFSIWAVLDRLDRDQQQKDFRNILGILVERQTCGCDNSFLSDRVRPRLMCSRQAMYLQFAYRMRNFGLTIELVEGVSMGVCVGMGWRVWRERLEDGGREERRQLTALNIRTLTSNLFSPLSQN